LGKIENIISRDVLVDQIRILITPSARSRFYPLIVGENGTGKTSLIQLAVDGLEKPQGVIYVDVPIEDESPVDLAQAMQQALGWNPDPVIDSDKRN
jgi:KaiC/GvpD/RAD55 family RecA-like ATPase